MSCCDKKRSRRRLAIWLAVVLGIASFTILSNTLGESAPTDTRQIAANATCPVTTEEKVDPDISTTYNGREVYFCCQRCKRKFERDPLAYVSNLPTNYFAAATPQAAVSVADASGPGIHEHETPSESHTQPASEVAGYAVARDQPNADHDEHNHDSEEDSDAEENADDHHGTDNTSGSKASGVGGKAHDHSAHGQDESQGLLMHFIGWLGKFHPPSVNFPIALMMAALIAEVLFMATGRPLFDAAGRFTVWFAIVGTIGAVTLGWFFGGFKLVDDDWIMTTHRWVGTAAGLWAFVLAWFAGKEWSGSARNPARSRSGYRVALLVGTALVSANGFFGGALMYGIDHYLW
jgi:uncharacterized membrane protein/YHS domain-containing protein